MPDITIGRLRGGFCVSWYVDGKRKRYQLEARNKADAEAEAIEVYRLKERASAPKEPTIAELWEAYREDLEGRPTGKTMKYTGKAILPHFGAHRPDHIDRDMCRKYADARRKDGKSQGTIWTELGHLRSTLIWAQKVKWIDRAPHVWRPEKPESDKRILNRGEARALIDAASAPHIQLALILLLGTAARVGAILELTWDRVDFDNNSINLRLEGQERRKGRAVVPMNSGVRAALSVAAEAALTDYVIEHAGGPIKSIRTGFANAVERSGIGKVTIHELRHTAAVTMLQAGMDMVKVSQMLGHSNTSITERVYARFLPSHMQDAADVLNFMEVRNARS